MNRRRHCGGAAVATVACFVALAASAPAALGHAAFLDSTPPPGTRLEEAPRTLTLQYTEPLIGRLTRATLTNLATGRRVPTTLRIAHGRGLTVQPASELPAGAYRVDWHTVSTEDGHALEGSFGFGVRAAAVGGEKSVQQSPLARDGWLRIVLRALFYAALIFFGGGLLNAVLLARKRAPGDWLLPAAEPTHSGPEQSAVRARLWGRTLDAGWLAVGAATAAVIAEGFDAGSGLDPDALAQFLFSNVAGVARVAMVVTLLASVVLASRRRGLAALVLAVTLLTISMSGHANSAEVRGLAVVGDWFHLLAGTVWLGGIGQIAAAWWQLRAGGRPVPRVAVMRDVLERFGKVAVPAFVVVVGSGLVSAFIQLGRPAAAWETPYGRVLAVKAGLVAVIGALSYVHAMRLRPRLVRASAPPAPKLERRHWALLRAEPLVGFTVVAAAAVLVTFPLPPRQLGEADEAEAAAQAQRPSCAPCPQRRARPGELAVAEHAGSRIVAAWVRRVPSGLAGEIRVLGRSSAPVAGAVAIDDAEQRGCGRGCRRFRMAGRPPSLRVTVSESGRRRTAVLPVRWMPGHAARARTLLEQSQSTMRALRSVRESERITSGPGSQALTNYRLRAPNRFAYRTDRGVQSLVVGRDQWLRTPDFDNWQRSDFGAGTPFSTRSWFRWTPYAESLQLRDQRGRGRRGTAELALYERGTPVWYRLWIDLRSRRVRRLRMITDRHFMDQRFYGFNTPVSIEPPARGAG